ncbi:glycosyltransferase [Xenorhabdus bovienii]|nr:glycosyltransferase [Xenorhabdus bovienii]
MATYNGEKYIKAQLKSILTQINNEDEIIISDDGSSDRTCQIIEEINDSRIKLFVHNRAWLPENSETIYRVAQNFEYAISLSKGELIFLSDQDDIWLPNRIESTFEHFNKGADLVVCDCEIVDKDGSILHASYFNIVNPSSNIIRTLYKSSFHGCCVAFKNDLIKYIIPFPKSSLGHDTWIGIISSYYGKISFDTNILIKYQRHENTVTQCGFKSKRSLYKKIIYRITLLKYFLLRAFIKK